MIDVPSKTISICFCDYRFSLTLM